MWLKVTIFKDQGDLTGEWFPECVCEVENKKQSMELKIRIGVVASTPNLADRVDDWGGLGRVWGWMTKNRETRMKQTKENLG